MVTFHTNHGDIVIKTFDDKAPETVKNFLDYCREGFYNNTIFHRVINGFMIMLTITASPHCQLILNLNILI